MCVQANVCLEQGGGGMCSFPVSALIAVHLECRSKVSCLSPELANLASLAGQLALGPSVSISRD